MKALQGCGRYWGRRAGQGYTIGVRGRHLKRGIDEAANESMR